MSFPNVSEALWGLTDTLQLVQKQAAVVDYQEKDTPSEPFLFEGVLQPMRAQRLLLKPEGERNWRWWTLRTELDIKISDQVIDPDGVTFRVVARTPWFGAGYYEYELAESTVSGTPGSSTVTPP